MNKYQHLTYIKLVEKVLIKFEKFKNEYNLLKLTINKIIYKHKICETVMEKSLSYFIKRPSLCNNQQCINSRFKKTCLKKYGVENPYQSEKIKKKIKKTCLKKYGQEYPAHINRENIDWKIMQNKRRQSLKNNNSYNTSKTEDRFYNKLCKIYGKENIVRNYKEERYPFLCDFYIKDFDFFIEYQEHWTHGDEPYDVNNISHLIKKCRWKSKNSKYYNLAVDVWTKRDVQKRLIAKQHKLNYYEVF